MSIQKYDKITSAVNRSLKPLREKRGVSRQELAEQTGISYNMLTQIENGHSKCNLVMYINILRALGVKQVDVNTFDVLY